MPAPDVTQVHQNRNDDLEPGSARHVATDGEVDEVILDVNRRLNEIIQARVRFEQRLDQLTKLGNERAIEETIATCIADGRSFWAAFVEVDKFKSVNTKFGYFNADALLQEIGKVLAEQATCFPCQASAFRMHGDEFYLIGKVRSNSDAVIRAVEHQLNSAREAISTIQLPISGKTNVFMNCTVSVGWAFATDVSSLTVRDVLKSLETAVDAAKFNGRNKVVRYSEGSTDSYFDSPRGDCSSCRCKFSFDILREGNKTDSQFHCPNCGTRIDRPTDEKPISDGISEKEGVVRLSPTTTPDDSE